MSLFSLFTPQLLTKSQKLDKILLELAYLKGRLDDMVVTLAQLDAGIAAENASITSLDQGINSLATLATQLDTDVAALVAKLNAGADYTNELNAVTSGSSLISQSASTLATGVTNVTSADASAAGA